MAISTSPTKSESKALHKVFDVAPAGRLFISVPGADIHLQSSDANRVEVDVFVSAPTENEALSVADRVKLRARAVDKQTVRLEARSIYQDGFYGWNATEIARMRIEVTVPRSFNVDIQAAGCDLDVQGLNGQLSLQIAGGSVRASRLKGRLELFAFGSDVAIDGFDGTKADLTASGGSLSGANIKAGKLTVNVASGDTSLSDIEGAIDLSFHSGKADVRGIIGPVQARSNGCACTLHLSNVEDTRFDVAGGDVAVHLPRKTDVRVLLEGDSLFLDEAFAFAGEREPHRIEGQLNNGKTWLRASVASGAFRCLAA